MPPKTSSTRGKRNRDDDEGKKKKTSNKSSKCVDEDGVTYRHSTAVVETLQESIKLLGITEQQDLKERDRQINMVDGFLKEECDVNARNQTLQLFGLPGTGKTAVVKLTLRRHPHLSSIILNGYVMQRPQEVYIMLWRHLAFHRLGQMIVDEHCSGEVAQKELERRFSTGNWGSTGSVKVCVVVVDEVDKCFEKSGKTLFKLVDWASVPGSHCKLITMANAMQLPERIDQKTRSRLNNTQKVIFPPYTADQLSTILNQRLKGTEMPAFTSSAMGYICREIAKHTGDVRRLLQIASASLHSVLTSKTLRLTTKAAKEQGGVTALQHVHLLVAKVLQDTSHKVVDSTRGEIPLLLITLLTKQTQNRRLGSRGGEHEVRISVHELFTLLNSTLKRLKEEKKVDLLVDKVSYAEFVRLLEPLWHIQMCSILEGKEDDAVPLAYTNTGAIASAPGADTSSGEGTECFWMYDDLHVVLLYEVDDLRTQLIAHDAHGEMASTVFNRY